MASTTAPQPPFTVQLARIAGARVIGTGSGRSADALRAIGPEPVTYGDGLVGRVRALAPAGITAGNGANAAPGAIDEIARAVAAGQLRVPIAASFPVDQIRAAVELQVTPHVHGKVVIDI